MLTGFQRGTSLQVKAITSLVRRMEGWGGKMWVPRARYSFKMSFWVVPASWSRATPRSSASAT